ncbi:glycosyltransferase family 2 protein [uncultured Dokdonia sp.]|uniref:glycosyltransferase family 2 protein n=1 Tax=uncultured Dokdonia sp. TaxID=575653 RepID=UPI002616B436|nr:glycosyltransferase family 2 protein [uncultured Dokdonia sp.]
MLISVIIPAYNVERFIKKTIQSALDQSQVGEVIVIDDGSTDSTLQIVSELQASTHILKVYQHKDGINKGRGATRNLGIHKATQDYIAFLDADDFYLEDRFKGDEHVFNDSNVDGVYNAVGFHFYREPLDSEKIHFKANTLSKRLKPEELFDGIVSSKYGYLHLNGLTVKKSVFDKSGYFNETLRVTQDSDIIFKMALVCNLYPSNIEEPVSKRGIHTENVFTKSEIYKEYNPKLFESLVSWSLKNKIKKDKIDTLLNWQWFHKFEQKKTVVVYTRYWIAFIFKNPRLMLSILAIKYFPIIRLRKRLFPRFYN